jgi:CheY-like chemotaxis protein
MVDFQTRSILAIDDEAGILASISRVLRRERYVIDAVASPEDALVLAQSRSYDLFLCDMLMPRISGFDLLRMFRTLAPQSPVVIMSGYTSDETEDRCIAEGATGFLGKPFTPQELLEAVKLAMVRDRTVNKRDMAGADYDLYSGTFTNGEKIAR